MASKIVTMAVLAGTLFAGCGSAEPASTPRSTPTSTGTTKELVAWVDSVCRVDNEDVWNPPRPVHPSEATEAHRPAIVAYLTEGRDHFTQLKTLVDGIGKSPVEGGDEVAANMRSKVGDIANELTAYAQEATWYPDIQGLYRLASMDLANWSIGSPSLGDLAKRDPQVAAAKKQAANC